MKEIWNDFELVYQHPRNVSKDFRKIYHPELGIPLYLYNFSKEASQLTDIKRILELFGSSVQTFQENL